MNLRRHSIVRPRANSYPWNPALFAAIALAVVLPFFVTGGLVVRSLVAHSFLTTRETHATRALAFDSLKFQLDEETGLRGYAATGDRLFLDPYRSGRANLGSALAKLRSGLSALGRPDAVSAADDAAAANADWVGTVAKPFLNSRSGRPESLAVHGKALVDRFRVDIERIDAVLTTLENAANDDASRAIDRVGSFLIAAFVLILGLAVAFVMQQTRLVARLDDERRQAESDNRRADALAVAYSTEKRIADTLQEAFSQRRLPSLPALRLSATYTPASEETRVGGDWYDAVELPGDQVLFAVGDVAGHGIEAAVTMSQARRALIASSMLDTDPAAVLSRVNAELLRERAPMVTAVAGFADARTYEFVYSSAGHPPPILIEPGRPPRLLEFGGPPLGVVEDAQYVTHRIQSVPHAMLVLYTDGAIEHSHDVFEGEALLLGAADKAAEAATGDPATAIHNAIFETRAVGDDVAILTVSFAGERDASVDRTARRTENANITAMRVV